MINGGNLVNNAPMHYPVTTDCLTSGSVFCTKGSLEGQDRRGLLLTVWYARVVLVVATYLGRRAVHLIAGVVLVVSRCRNASFWAIYFIDPSSWWVVVLVTTHVSCRPNVPCSKHGELVDVLLLDVV